MLDGGPGFSAVAFAPIAAYILSLDAGVTVYLPDQRGTGASSLINCDVPPTAAWFDPSDAATLAQFAACNAEIATRYAATAQFYSTHAWAEDLLAAINAVVPLASAGGAVAIYALSYGTYATNTYLQLPGARADVVLLDGPVPANRWALENNPVGVAMVAQDIFRLCASSSATCAARIGAMGQLPRYVMDAIIDGSLPCLARLPWLSQHVAATYAASMTLGGPSHVAHAPFWWRLYRCSDSDVQQLNVLRAYHLASEVAPSPPEYSYALSVIIGSSEVYSFAGAPGGSGGLSYAEQVTLTSRVLADATPQTLVAFARDGPSGDGSGAVPRYAPNPATYMRIATPSVPTLVLVGTLDPNTPHGLGPWLVAGLGANAALVTVPYSAHGTVAYNAPCANSIAFNFLLAYGSVRAADVDTSCLASIPVPDFDGVSADTQALSRTLYGTPDLWNTGGPLPTATPSPTPVPSGGGNGGYIGVIGALAVATTGLAAYSVLLRRRLGAAAAGGARTGSAYAELPPA